MSPQQLTEPVFSKKKINKANNCGEKPIKLHTELKEQTTKIIEILRPTKIIVNFSKSGKIVKTILKRPSYGVIAGTNPKNHSGLMAQTIKCTGNQKNSKHTKKALKHGNNV